MYCVRCGNVVPEGAAFCRTCGQAVSVSPASSTEAMGPASSLESPIAMETSPVPALPMAPYASPSPSIRPSLMAPYAGFWLRVAAYLIDSAILTVAFGVVVAICIASFGIRFFRGFAPGTYDRPPNPLFPAAVLGVILVLLPITIAATWLYFALMEASAHQGTLGKIALGLFVTDLQGRRISFGRASGRFFAKIVTGLIPFFIGYIMAGFTEKRQALHDMIASCLVLKKI